MACPGTWPVDKSNAFERAATTAATRTVGTEAGTGCTEATSCGSTFLTPYISTRARVTVSESFECLATSGKHLIAARFEFVAWFPFGITVAVSN